MLTGARPATPLTRTKPQNPPAIQSPTGHQSATNRIFHETPTSKAPPKAQPPMLLTFVAAVVYIGAVAIIAWVKRNDP